MKLGEKILLSLSRKPGTESSFEKSYQNHDALSSLVKGFPQFVENLDEKRILDFGCGNGHQIAALALRNAECVIGLDTNPRCVEAANELIKKIDNVCDVQVTCQISEEHVNSFDIVISHNSFEHFHDPIDVLDTMNKLLKPGGKIYIIFGPPWYAPYGSHMHYFTKIPWLNILFSEKTIMNVRSRFRQDGASKFEEVEGGLNKMSVRKFNTIVSNSGMIIDYLKYDCVKGLDFLSKIPIVRELFINNVGCILSKPNNQ